MKMLKATQNKYVDTTLKSWTYRVSENSLPHIPIVGTGFIALSEGKYWGGFMLLPEYMLKGVVKEVLEHLIVKCQHDLWVEMDLMKPEFIGAAMEVGFLGIDRDSKKMTMVRRK